MAILIKLNSGLLVQKKAMIMPVIQFSQIF